jgi:hypothetical protein
VGLVPGDYNDKLSEMINTQAYRHEKYLYTMSQGKLEALETQWGGGERKRELVVLQTVLVPGLK